MSRTHGVLLPRIVLKAELRKFVEEAGGTWHDNPGFPQGVINYEDVTLFIRGIDSQMEDLSATSPEELLHAEQACGQKIVGVLEMAQTRGTKGDDFAGRILKRMVERWGGYIDSD